MIWFPFGQNTINLEMIGHFQYPEASKNHKFLQNSLSCQQLTQNCQSSEKQNQQLKNQIFILQNKLKAKNKLKARKIKRRSQNELTKNFQCLYSQCKKQYASQLALNLHMKMKHNAGSKRDRQKLMNEIRKAESEGRQLPKTSINLPPGFLQKYKIGDSGFEAERNVHGIQIECMARKQSIL